MEKIKELLSKIKTLSERGENGEKQNAEKILNALLKKHNLNIEDLNDLRIISVFFDIDSRYWRLLYQITKSVNYDIKCYGEFPKKVIRQNRLDGNYMIECTLIESIEIKAKYDFYLNLYNKELDIFFQSFIQANEIFPETKQDVECKKMTDEEKEDAIRVLKLSQNIKKGIFNKQLD